MEKHQHNIAFEESYWEDALAVLKKEERKQRLRRLAFFLPICILFIFAAASVIFALQSSAEGTAKVNSPGWKSKHSLVKENESELFRNEPSEERKTVQDEPALKNLGSGTIVDKSTTALFSKMEQEAITVEVNKNSTKLNFKNSIVSHVPLKVKATEQSQEPNSFKAKPPSGSRISEQTTGIVSSAEFKYLKMPFINFSGFEPIGRPGLNYQLKQLNRRDEAFRKWSLQPQQWMIYLGNAFSKDYAAEGALLSFNPQVGIAFEQHMAPNLYLRFGLGVQQFSNVYVAEEFKEVQATFGYQYRSTEIATHRLYVLDVPINVIYDFKLRHAVILGFGLEYIGFTKNIVKTEMVNAFNREVLSSENDFGYLSGYSPLFWNAQIGYRYRFNRRASFDVVLSSGFDKIHESSNEGNTRINARFNFNLR